MNSRQKKKKSKEYIRKQKKFSKKQGIKLRNNKTNGSRYKIETIIVYQSLEQIKQTYNDEKGQNARNN